MALQRTQKTECVEHTKDIINLKKDMESVLRHEKKFNDSIDNLELVIADLKLTLSLFNERFKDLPLKVRTLEDKDKSKSKANEIIEKLAWIIVGGLIVAIIHQNFIATKETPQYKVQSEKSI